MPKKIFITGITGCCGQYIYDQFKNDFNYHLYLLIRPTSQNAAKFRENSNLTLLSGDLSKIEDYKNILKSCQQIIHLAVDWGNVEVNYEQTLKFFDLLDEKICEKIIYFSTASILGAENQPITEARDFGTPYIAGKYKILNDLPRLAVYPKIITLFPTAIAGGDQNHPFSHVAEAIKKLPFYLKFLRFFTAEGGFHFIHAEDIAKITKYLIENRSEKHEFVLGNSYITLEEFLAAACKHFKIYRPFKIKIAPGLIINLAKILRIKISPWGLFCLNYRHFKFKTVNAQSFGMESRYLTLESILPNA